MEQSFSKYPTNTELAIYSSSKLIEEIVSITNEIDALRPLSKDTEDRIMQKLRLDWNYNSNAIEGNSLDYGETVAFLMHGVTAKGKPLKDYLDIRGHNKAINFLLDLIRNNEDFSEKDIRSLHEIILVEPYKSTAQTSTGEQVYKTILLGRYKTMPNHVKTVTGEIHYYATPEDTPILMGELMDWYRSTQELKGIHPIVIASVFHHKFVSIHPFDDGNGRMARLLMNMILMKHHYPPVIIKKEKKEQYYLCLSQADSGNIEPFVNYISEGLFDTVQLYLKGAKGESIEEPSDLDKKLLLFKKEIEARQDRLEMKKNDEIVYERIFSSVEPLVNASTLVISKFKDLFISADDYLIYYSTESYPMVGWLHSNANIFDFFTNLRLEKMTLQSKNDIVFCFQFRDFKVMSNSFSMEVKIFVIFDELNYSISYTVTPLNQIQNFAIRGLNQLIGKPYIEKFYHQDLSSSEIEKFTNSMGDNIFSYIEYFYSNGDVQLDISQQDVEVMWKIFLRDQIHDDSVRDVFVNLNEIYFSNNIISINVDIKGNEDIYIENGKYIEENFYHFINKNSTSPKRILVQLI